MLAYRKAMICIAAAALTALVCHAAIGAGGDDWTTRDAASESAAKIAQGANANAVLSLDLIADGGAGNRRDDGVTTGAVSGPGTTIAIEVFATGVSTSLRGVILRFDFDASLVRFVRAENSAFALAVPEGSIGVNLASTSPVTVATSGFLARAEFETVADVTGREFSIGVERVTLAESVTSSDVITTTSVIAFNATRSPDFDGDGTVGFSDLLLFAGSFGTGEGDSRFEARFDLNGDGSVGFADLLIFAGVFGAAVVPPPPPPPEGGLTVTIADDNLRAVIADSLGKTRNAPITRGEMATLTRLDAPNKGIRNLTGLEHATNLSTLDLGFTWVGGELVNSNDISDLSPLSHLINLTLLLLGGNSISDISALSGLTKLTELDLTDNSISDISALAANAGLGEGDHVFLNGNPLSSASRDTHIPALHRRGVNVEYDRGTGGGGGSRPDLVVESVSVSASSLTPGQSFTLSATLRNQGGASTVATTWRFYRSSDATISTDDTQEGIVGVGLLSAGYVGAETISLNAPSVAGTYYYGACVDAVSGESNTDNNCSSGVSVTVTSASSSRASKLYWTDSGTDKIQRSNLDGSSAEDLVTTGLDWPRGIAVDGSGGKIYWTDSGTDKIQRSNLDGSGVEDLVTTGLRDTWDIALDVSGGKIYWTDYAAAKIRRSNLDGSGVEDLVTTGLRNPWGIAVDASGGKIYWADTGATKIQRSNLDGSSVEDLVTTGLSPSGIAVDTSGGKIYWTSWSTNKIQRSNLDGSSVEDLVTTGLSPSGIAVDTSGGKIYWAVTNARKIRRSNLDGSGVEDLVTSGLRAPSGIALGLPSVESGPVVEGPDLVVTTSVDDNTLTTGQSFTLSATVRNRGNASTGSTTLRYYRSSDATISTDDTEVGTDRVGGLSAGGTSAESISLNAPSDAGTYTYGACVDGVSGESNTDNNCSSGVSVTVSSSGGGGGNDKAVTTSLTSCRSTQSGFIYNILIAGTVHASRSVSNVLIRGYAGTSFVGIASIGSMSAGQSRSFTITGIVSSRPSTCRIETTWLQGGNTSQGVVEHHSIVVDERERR